jgi:hypothetical protein
VTHRLLPCEVGFITTILLERSLFLRILLGQLWLNIKLNPRMGFVLLLDGKGVIDLLLLVG